MKNRYSEIINELTDKELMLQLIATQLLLLGCSIVLGYFFFPGHSFWKQVNFYDIRIITVGIPSGLIVFLIDFVLMKWLPSSFYDDGGLNEKIFRNRRVVQIALIALLVAFSEEILFRGMIQTKIGLYWASIIFAAIHYRYLFRWYLFFNIVLLSFFIGLIYVWTNNVAVTITMHFVIDFMLGIYIKWKNMQKEKGQEGWLNE